MSDQPESDIEIEALLEEELSKVPSLPQSPALSPSPSSAPPLSSIFPEATDEEMRRGQPEFVLNDELEFVPNPTAQGLTSTRKKQIQHQAGEIADAQKNISRASQDLRRLKLPGEVVDDPLHAEMLIYMSQAKEESQRLIKLPNKMWTLFDHKFRHNRGNLSAQKHIVHEAIRLFFYGCRLDSTPDDVTPVSIIAPLYKEDGDIFYPQVYLRSYLPDGFLDMCYSILEQDMDRLEQSFKDAIEMGYNGPTPKKVTFTDIFMYRRQVLGAIQEKRGRPKKRRTQEDLKLKDPLLAHIPEAMVEPVVTDVRIDADALDAAKSLSGLSREASPKVFFVPNYLQVMVQLLADELDVPQNDIYSAIMYYYLCVWSVYNADPMKDSAIKKNLFPEPNRATLEADIKAFNSKETRTRKYRGKGGQLRWYGLDETDLSISKEVVADHYLGGAHIQVPVPDHLQMMNLTDRYIELDPSLIREIENNEAEKLHQAAEAIRLNGLFREAYGEFEQGPYNPRMHGDEAELLRMIEFNKERQAAWEAEQLRKQVIQQSPEDPTPEPAVDPEEALTATQLSAEQVIQTNKWEPETKVEGNIDLIKDLLDI